MTQYVGMSQVYDQLTQDQPYDKWFEIVQHYSQNFNHKPNILDLGCGTGSLTAQLNTIGSVTGMDLSSDMLAIAANKSNQVSWLEGDMTDFSFKNEFDVITIFCDSLNYLPDIEDVNKTFINVFNHLSENGVFIFDVHTIYKMSTLFHNQCYIDENESTFLAWEAIQGDEPFSVYHEMSFFIEDNNGTYQRFNESHYQRTFEKETYINMLNQIGFKNIETFIDFNRNNHDDHGERLFFVAFK